MSTTLILGGTGFVSGTMARTARAQGHTTYTLTRGTCSKLKTQNSKLNNLHADRNNPAVFATALEKAPPYFDLVVDCIGFCAAHAQQDLDTFFPQNAPPRRGGAGHLVFLSSDFVASPIDRPPFIDETFDRFDTAPYATGKRDAEVLLLNAAATRQLPITILRPCHLYGPGSLLGCLPLHGRDPQLLTRLRQGEPIRLLGGGHFLQQPMLAEDLATLALACPALPATRGQLYFVAGPEIIESRAFFRTIADLLGLPITIEEANITDYLKDHPDHRAFCCHRLYTCDKARAHGLPLPTTPVREGLTKHLASLSQTP